MPMSSSANAGWAANRRDIATAHLGPIFVEGHIPHPMRLVFDVPVPSHQCQQARRISTLRCQTGDARHDLFADLSRLFADDLPLQLEHLPQTRPVTVA